jgi:hypothetical protein
MMQWLLQTYRGAAKIYILPVLDMHALYVNNHSVIAWFAAMRAYQVWFLVFFGVPFYICWINAPYVVIIIGCLIETKCNVPLRVWVVQSQLSATYNKCDLLLRYVEANQGNTGLHCVAAPSCSGTESVQHMHERICIQWNGN